VQANAVFAIIPQKAIKPLEAKYPFYIWDEETLELRWMCSFDTTEEDIENFVSTLRDLL
jgi:threonine aldolase